MVPDETPTSVDVNDYVDVLLEELDATGRERVQFKTIIRGLRQDVARLEAKVASLESVPVEGDYPEE